MKSLPFASTVCLALLVAACSSRSGYRDAGGRPVPNAGNYQNTWSSSSPAEQRISQSPATTPWPRTVIREGYTNTIYQLQIDSWDGSAITGRNAVSVQAPGQPPVYGVIHVRATTVVDKPSRSVSLLNFQVTDAEFPSAEERQADFQRMLSRDYPAPSQLVSLEVLESTLAANAQRLKVDAGELKNEPPRIIFSEKPAVLVYIDGEPVLRKVEGTDLERVINTRYLLVKSAEGKFFLLAGQQWLTSGSLTGAWTPAPAPAGWQTAQTQAAGQVEEPVVSSSSDQTAAAVVPEIHVATSPTELIVTGGAPNFVPIPGTQLLYVTNTTANVFKHLKDQSNYVLLSGRWFRAPSFEGPWQYVPGRNLPPDFAAIPDESPKENVKASVPGTPQAQEALVANSIPQTTAVRRANQMEDPQIDGPPRLEPIAGTPLHYVVNSGTPIIQVDANSWYACQNGVWYVATSVNGPWTVADSVPAVIYGIPVSSPMHYVTYVRVYNATTDVVYHGYTPGYMGTVVDNNDVVVYGTGYYYRPWVGGVWYGAPMTWGFAWSPYWSPWYGWSYGFGFGWYAGYWPYYYYPYSGLYHCHTPWWGPYRYYARSVSGRMPAQSPERWASTSANIYRRPTRGVQSATVIPTRGAPTYARAYNSRTGNAVAGEQAQVQNAFTRTRTGSEPRGRYPVVYGPRATAGQAPESGVTPPRSSGERSVAREPRSGGSVEGFNRRSREEGSGGAPAYAPASPPPAYRGAPAPRGAPPSGPSRGGRR